MPRFISLAARFASRFALFSAFLAPAQTLAAPPARNSDYENGVAFATDGGLPGGPCFRLEGVLSSPDFFNGLKRVRTKEGIEFRRGELQVTQFPAEMNLQFRIRDFPCPENIERGGPRKYLTREWVAGLRISFFWKHGMSLRPADGVTRRDVTVERAVPQDLGATNLPERFLWRYSAVVPSAQVPLTDHLVIAVRAADGTLVARVAARM